MKFIESPISLMNDFIGLAYTFNREVYNSKQIIIITLYNYQDNIKKSYHQKKLKNLTLYFAVIERMFQKKKLYFLNQ